MLGIDNNLLTFVIVSFVLAMVLLLSREQMPPQLRRPLAIFAIVMVALSFCLVVYQVYRLGM